MKFLNTWKNQDEVTVVQIVTDLLNQCRISCRDRKQKAKKSLSFEGCFTPEAEYEAET
jgi:hypothetical protein